MQMTRYNMYIFITGAYDWPYKNIITILLGIER